MAGKRLTRINLHKRICDLSGSRSKSTVGYLSRKEMMELLMYLERVQKACAALCHMKNETVSHIIIEGKIYNEPAATSRRA